jgi:hypothetical protein
MAVKKMKEKKNLNSVRAGGMQTSGMLLSFHVAMAALHSVLCSIVIYISVTRRCFPLASGDCDTVYI